MVRRAKGIDIDQILVLLDQVNRIHANSRPDIFNVATKYSKVELENKIENEPIFVYVDNDKVLGYIFGLIQDNHSRLLKDNKTFFIDDFCVDENYRGKHIGSTLYEEVKKYAKSIDCKRITLNVWSFNDNAYRFYTYLGLKPLETVMEEKI